MKIPFLLLVILLTSCLQTEVVEGEIVNFPQPFTANDCASLLHLSRPGLNKMHKEVSRHGETYQAYSWRDTLFSVNDSVLGETYFGGFSLSLKRDGLCDWLGTLDSIRFEFGDSDQTITVPQDAIYLRKNRGPDVELFGNDTTIIQGFKIFLDGFSGGTNNSVYDYYLFNSVKGTYVKSTTLSELTSPNINLVKGIVTSSWTGGAAGRIGGRTTYKLLENGGLEFLRSWNSKRSGRDYFVERVEMKNGEKMKWSDTVTDENWEEGIRY